MKWQKLVKNWQQIRWRIGNKLLPKKGARLTTFGAKTKSRPPEVPNYVMNIMDISYLYFSLGGNFGK